MNIFKRELRAGRKAFLLWMIGMFLLCFAGIVKYESFSMGGGMEELLAAFPRVVLAAIGVNDVNMNTLSGYTALLFYYVLVCAVVYAVLVGVSAVNREFIDKTHEFLFAKPCERAHILAAKLAAAIVYLVLFSLANAVFAYVAASTLEGNERAADVIFACALAVLLISILFAALAAFLAAAIRKPEKGALCANLSFLAAFVLGVVLNMLESPGTLRLLSPFNYFPSSELARAYVHPLYALLSLVLTALFLFGAFRLFEKRDFT